MGILNLLQPFSRWAKASTPSAPAVSVPLIPAPQTIREVPREACYPPRDQGLPVVEPQALLDATPTLLKRLRELTVSDASQFEAAYLQPLRNLAELVHLLPASASDHYAAPGGLFRLCADMSYFALQSADGKIFTPHGTVEQRHKNEPRWRYATFLAAMACQIHRAFSLLTVTNDKGEEWPRFTTSLHQWLVQSGAQRYYVVWHQPVNVTGAEGAAVLSKITPAARMDWLAEGDVQIVRDMHQVAMGAAHASDNIMANVVNGIVRRVMEVDEATRRNRYGRLTVGMHAEPYVLDAMREAIEAGRWKVNQLGSPVWYGSDGLFIEWPRAHADVLAFFDRNGLAGMPRSSVTLAEMLGKAAIVIGAENGLWVRDVLLPQDDGQRSRASTALRFVDALAIFGHMQAAHAAVPFGAELVQAESQAGANLVSQPKDDKQKATPQPELAQAVTDTVTAGDKPATPSASGPIDASGDTTVAQSEHAKAQPQAAPAPDPATGEIVYADLIPASPRKWLKSPDIAETLGRMIQLQKEHRGEVVKSFPFGVALSVDWIGDESPTDITRYVKALETNGWIGRPPGVKNDAIKLHDLQFDDAVKKAIVLSVQGAQALGFAAGARSK